MINGIDSDSKRREYKGKGRLLEKYRTSHDLIDRVT